MSLQSLSTIAVTTWAVIVGTRLDAERGVACLASQPLKPGGLWRPGHADLGKRTEDWFVVRLRFAKFWLLV